MNDLIIFLVGFVIFGATSSATMIFAYLQFNQTYREDRNQATGAPPLKMEGATEIEVSPASADRTR